MKSVIVFGGGLSGKGAEKLLKKNGYKVYLIDDKNALPTIEGINILKNEKIEFIVKSPGINWETDLLKEAMKLKVNIVSEIDLAYEYMDKSIKIIGITGTNGKTTTATKIYELLKMANKKVALSGNVGNSFAEMVADEKELDYIVLELSSYQLENNPKIHCHIGGIINLTPDHLTRYSSIKEYYLTKFNIFKNQGSNDYALVNLDDIEFMKLYNERDIDSKKIHLSQKIKGNIGVFENSIYYNKGDNIAKLIDVENVGLKGKHNLENLLFVVAVGKILDISNDIIVEFLKEVKPLEHRLENFYTKGNCTFVNDSKGTNVDSTLRAIDSFHNKIILILGGDNKGISNTELIEKVVKKVDFVYLIGENAPILIGEMEKQNYKNYKDLGTLEKVIIDLKDKINYKEDITILLSPATSSWCQYANYEERGKDFKNLVKNIIN